MPTPRPTLPVLVDAVQAHFVAHGGRWPTVAQMTERLGWSTRAINRVLGDYHPTSPELTSYRGAPLCEHFVELVNLPEGLASSVRGV